jgi:hypothetical protein
MLLWTDANLIACTNLSSARPGRLAASHSRDRDRGVATARGGSWYPTNVRNDVALTLNALKTGRIGADASLGGKYSKSDWEGLQGGIGSGLTELQAGQADKARACLAPYMPGIVQAILQSK